MTNDDFSGVTVSFDAASYTAGQIMTLTVNGQNKHTSDASTSTEQVTVDAQIRSASGATHTVTSAPVTVTHTTPGQVTFENVTIVSVTDTGGRSWSVAVGGKTATAVA